MTKKVGRNEPCFCGSGKKYKQCCLLKEKSAPSKYNFDGSFKFKASVIDPNKINHKYNSIFKKISEEKKEVIDSLKKEVNVNKKILEKKVSKELRKHSFSLMNDLKKEERFTPTNKDFRVKDDSFIENQD